MVTLHEVITFLVSMQISISSLQTHNVNRCGRRSEERFSRNAETDIVCRLLLEKKKRYGRTDARITRAGGLCEGMKVCSSPDIQGVCAEASTATPPKLSGPTTRHI